MQRPVFPFVVKLSQDTSERLARVVHRIVAPGTCDDNFASLEDQSRRLGLFLVDQPDYLVRGYQASNINEKSIQDRSWEIGMHSQVERISVRFNCL